MYTNIDHAMGLQASRDIMSQCQLFDLIIEPLDLSLKSNDFMFNGERYIPKVVTSISRD